MTEVEVKDGNKTTNLSFTDEILSFKVKKKKFTATNKVISIPARNILSITLDKTKDIRVIINALVPKGKVNLKLKTYSFEAIDEEAAQLWIKTIDLAAYKGTNLIISKIKFTIII